MKNRRRCYTIRYKLHRYDDVQEISLFASSKVDAWDLATYGAIPFKHHEAPYSVWVASVTFHNGKTRSFNTFEGKPY